MSKFYISKEKLTELRNSGRTIPDIADSYGVSYNTIARLINAYGMSKPTDRTDIKDEDVIKAWDDGMTIRQIAGKFKCSHDTVTKRLDRHGISCNRASGIRRHFASTYDKRWPAIKEDLDKGIAVSTVRDIHHIRIDNLKMLMEKNGYTCQNQTLVENLCSRIAACSNDRKGKTERFYLSAIKFFLDENQRLPDLHILASYTKRHTSTVSQASIRYSFREFLDGKTMSQWVSVLVSDLCRLGIVYELNNRKILDGKELDIYIPSKKLGIEINPVGTHSTDTKTMGISDKRYHQKKALLAEKAGIGLLHLYDCDFTDKNNYEKLLLYLTDHEKTKTGARKCQVMEITAKEANTFLKQYHFKNGDNCSKYRIGLYYGSLLCGVLTIGKPRYTSVQTYEIIRYCMHPDYIIPGCFGKMFSFFMDRYCQTGDNIISYMDLNKRFTADNVYEKNGFVPDGITAPDYMWVHKYGSETLKRYATTKERLVRQGYDKNKTENEIMLERGYMRVYGAGSKRYLFTVP